MVRFRGFRAALLIWSTLVALPAVSSAQQLDADVDGDTVRDRIETTYATRLVVRIANGGVQWLRAESRIVSLALADVNRDGLKDLVARTEHAGLHVWTNHGGGRFNSHAPRRGPPAPPVATSTANAAGDAGFDTTFGDTQDAAIALVVLAVGPALTVTLIGHHISPARSRDRHRGRIPRGPPPALLVA